jgi:hypothetical protein
MEQDFLNTYIENMSKKLADFQKQEILISTQLELAQKLIVNLTEENKSLKENLEKAQNKKLNKKEVDTSQDTF